jgi:hypothetical protein
MVMVTNYHVTEKLKLKNLIGEKKYYIFSPCFSKSPPPFGLLCLVHLQNRDLVVGATGSISKI